MSCNSRLGQTIPECDDAGSSTILSIQAVPGTAYVPCINGLKTGWKYIHLEAKSGQSVFWLDSDRLGGGGPAVEENPFLEVKLLPACDTSGAVEVESDEPDVPLFVDVEASVEVRITVVPDSGSLGAGDHAGALQRALNDTLISDRTVVATIDTSNTDTKDRISLARASGAAVLVVGTRDAEEGTATLVLRGADEIPGLDLDDVIERLEDITGAASYTGFWYYPFANGCIVYSFDAHGSGVSTIEADVQLALGLFDAEALRQVARESGYDPG